MQMALYAVELTRSTLTYIYIVDIAYTILNSRHDFSINILLLSCNLVLNYQ